MSVSVIMDIMISDTHTSISSVKSTLLLLVLVDLPEETRDDSERIIIGALALLGEAFEEVGLRLRLFRFVGDTI